MMGDAGGLTMYETHGGTMSMTIAAVLNGDNAVVCELDTVQWECGNNRLKADLRKRLDDRANLSFTVPIKHMLVHEDDINKDVHSARFLPSLPLLFGKEGDGLAVYRTALQALKVFLS
jgi:hypothetical protein